MPLTIYFETKALHKYLGDAERKWPEAAGRALEKVGRAVFDQSQREVPKGKTHILAGSTLLSIGPKTVTITYFATYARAVHFRKAKHPQGGKRKFLTGPLGKGKRILGDMIAAEVQEEMDKGVAG